MNMNVIKLENNEDYVIMDLINIDNNNYVVLVNEKDNTDVCVRKIVNIDGKDNIKKLESNDELEKVMSRLYESHRKEGTNE